MSRKKVLIICGGKSGEHEVSLISGTSIARALSPEKFDVSLLVVSPKGQWFLPQNTEDILHSSSQKMPSLSKMREILCCPQEDAENFLPLLKEKEIRLGNKTQKFDVIFPIIHGTNGEDGTLQGFLELAGVAYVGPGVLGSAVGMDKDVTKRLLRDAGIPIVPYFCLKKQDWKNNFEEALAKVEKEFGYPFFIKPANSGSSVGVSKIKDKNQAFVAFEKAFCFDRKIMVEKACIGRELECAILGNHKPQASIVGEIKPTHEFYSYEAKYVDEKGADLLIPALLKEEDAQKIREYALKAFEVLECEGLSRVDFFYTPSGEIYLNEINTLPGFTPISMYPQLWQATGLSYPDLLEKLIHLAFERHEEKKALLWSVEN